MFVIAEWLGIAVSATIIALWIREPEGPYEPILAGVALVAIVIDLVRRCFLKNPRQSVSGRPPLAERILGSIETEPLSKLLPQALETLQDDGDPAFSKWLRLELYGYTPIGGRTDNDNVPEYRNATGRHRDTRGNLIAFDSRLAFINSLPLPFGVKQLEELTAKEEGISLHDGPSAEFIRKNFGHEVHSFDLHASEVVAVLDRIRNIFREKFMAHLARPTSPKVAKAKATMRS